MSEILSRDISTAHWGDRACGEVRPDLESFWSCLSISSYMIFMPSFAR
jgi:hypothetical protein